MEEGVLVESMTAMRDKQPYVVLTWGNKRVQMTPEEARAHALSILTAAECAEGDAFIVHFMTTKIKTGEREAAMMLGELRQFRQAQGTTDKDL